MPSQTTSDPNVKLREVEPHRWRFHAPRLNEARVYERFDRAVDLMQSGEDGSREAAIPILRPLVREFPEFIDAQHHLALALEWTGEIEKAYQLWKTAVAKGFQLLPSHFCIGRDQLEWGFLDNRPFLRAYHSLGLAHLRRAYIGEAAAVFNNLLDLNPNDNQGARSLLVGCLIRMRRPGDVLLLCARYEGTADPELLYGRVLAHYMLGQEDEAAAAARRAIAVLPLVARELAKPSHRRPRTAVPGYVTVGGADEAYDYWSEYGPLWKQVRGALAFLERVETSPGLPGRNR